MNIPGAYPQQKHPKSPKWDKTTFLRKIADKLNHELVQREAKNIIDQLKISDLSIVEEVKETHKMCLQSGKKILKTLTGQEYNRERPGDFEAMQYIGAKIMEQIDNPDLDLLKATS